MVVKIFLSLLIFANSAFAQSQANFIHAPEKEWKKWADSMFDGEKIKTNSNNISLAVTVGAGAAIVPSAYSFARRYYELHTEKNNAIPQRLKDEEKKMRLNRHNIHTTGPRSRAYKVNANQLNRSMETVKRITIKQNRISKVMSLTLKRAPRALFASGIKGAVIFGAPAIAAVGITDSIKGNERIIAHFAVGSTTAIALNLGYQAARMVLKRRLIFSTESLGLAAIAGFTAAALILNR